MCEKSEAKNLYAGSLYDAGIFTMHVSMVLRITQQEDKFTPNLVLYYTLLHEHVPHRFGTVNSQLTHNRL